MKIRNGFISNSSSSSFVLIGCRISDEDLAKALNVDDTDDLYDVVNETDLYWDAEDGIIGYTIAEGNDGDFEGDTLTIPELMEKAKEISEKLSIPLEEIKIISGTRYC